MQENIKLIIYTIAGIFVLWFIALTVNRNIFLHSDVDSALYGTVAMNKTDIGEQCGASSANNFEIIEYKLNQRDQIVYLCPQDLWPIQKQVVAVSISDDLRRTFAPAVQKKLAAFYPVPAAPVAAAVNTVAPVDQSTQQQTPANAPLQKSQNLNQAPSPTTPAAANPFIQPGAQAPAAQAPVQEAAPAQQALAPTQTPDQTQTQAPIPVGPVSSAPPSEQ